MRKFWAYPSSYVILILWGAAGFGYQPSFATFIVHFLITPVIMYLALELAHREGRKEGKNRVDNVTGLFSESGK